MLVSFQCQDSASQLSISVGQGTLSKSASQRDINPGLQHVWRYGWDVQSESTDGDRGRWADRCLRKMALVALLVQVSRKWTAGHADVKMVLWMFMI